MRNDETYAKWCDWLDLIRNEVANLALNRHIFWQIQKMVDDNPDLQKPSIFKNVFANMYVESAAIGLRRQLKVDGDSVSLKRLLSQICKMPQVLSRNRYVDMFVGTEYLKQMAHGYFDEHAGEGGKHIDCKLVEADIGKLEVLTKSCEDYADRRVAHRDKRQLKKIPTHAELNKALDFLEELVKKYFLIIKAEEAFSEFPPPPPENWKAIFRIPWLGKD